jgi:hypothetical protein
MNRLNSVIRAVVAASFCFSVFAMRPAFAVEDTLEAVQAKIVALEAAQAKLKADIAKADAQIAAAQPIVVTAAHVSGASTHEVKPIMVTAMHVSAVPAHEVKEVTAPALVQVATFTTTTPAEGWHAWARQSREYKKANGWEKILSENCAREPRICKRTAPRGTAFYLPAPEIRVIVQSGMEAPEAIALAATAVPNIFVLDMKIVVVTKRERALTEEVREWRARSVTGEKWLLGAVVAGIFLFGLFVIALEAYGAKSRLAHERDVEIAQFKQNLDKTIGLGDTPYPYESNHGKPGTPDDRGDL